PDRAKAKQRPARRVAATQVSVPAADAVVLPDVTEELPLPPVAAKQRSGRRKAANEPPVTLDPQPAPPARQPAPLVMTPPIMVELNAVAEGWPTRSRFDVVVL